MNPVERGKFPKVKVASIPTPCMHCDEAPCIKAATGGAIYKRPDGIVIIDPVKSVGQKQIVNSCPYGVIYWNNQLNIPQKCTLCAHRVDAGGDPKCVLSCPVNAMVFGEVEDLSKTPGAVPLYPELGTKPRVYYIGLPKTFITGALVDSNGESLAGADVKATDTATNQVAASTKSDFWGDFRFELEPQENLPSGNQRHRKDKDGLCLPQHRHKPRRHTTLEQGKKRQTQTLLSLPIFFLKRGTQYNVLRFIGIILST